MNLTVRLFAAARERAGVGEAVVDLPIGATVADVQAALAEACPALGPLLPSCLIAVNAEYAAEGRVVCEGDELALIPPVSGG
ncbi:MAG: MoaD/ThiS family protein [Pirellulales bacterium]|nr:MoaD/ThiS family protein [Pirellulales bacterium]MBX3432641.1 MoaD/ThiS family protein [Pirellulales bacterium]